MGDPVPYGPTPVVKRKLHEDLMIDKRFGTLLTVDDETNREFAEFLSSQKIWTSDDLKYLTEEDLSLAMQSAKLHLGTTTVVRKLYDQAISGEFAFPRDSIGKFSERG